MILVDWLCPICKDVVRYWGKTTLLCRKTSCKEQVGSWVELPDGSKALADVEMVAIAISSIRSSTHIIRDI